MSATPIALPASRVPDSATAPPLRWGVLGTGWAASRFVDSLHGNSRQRVVAVGSRSGAKAATFARPFGIHRAYGSYEAVVSDPHVDVVYIATPHNHHVENGLLALDAGKHVLIEKPISLSSEGLETLLAVATTRGLLVQEAFWTFFLPKYDVIRQLVADGALGEIRSVVADHGEWFADDHRIQDPALAGGALNDLGAYPIALATWVLGRPTDVRASATWSARGVPADVALLMRHGAGGSSTLTTTIRSTTPCRAAIVGTEATVLVDGAFFMPGRFSVEDAATTRRLRYDEPSLRHDALHFQAAEVARRITTGELCSPSWSHDDSREFLAALESAVAALPAPDPLSVESLVRTYGQ
jgi:predicted dehydrogenase